MDAEPASKILFLLPAGRGAANGALSAFTAIGRLGLVRMPPLIGSRLLRINGTPDRFSGRAGGIGAARRSLDPHRLAPVPALLSLSRRMAARTPR